MISLIFAFMLLLFTFWVAKKFYFPIQVAQNPENYEIITERLSKRELETVLKHLKRWKDCGKITRQEYDTLTDVILGELRFLNEHDQGDSHV